MLVQFAVQGTHQVQPRLGSVKSGRTATREPRTLATVGPHLASRTQSRYRPALAFLGSGAANSSIAPVERPEP